MQTFVPSDSMRECARVLDRARLGKQRVETLQIMSALTTGKGWISHPATLMWKGSEWSLLDYQAAIVNEWTTVRGYSDTCYEKTLNLYMDWQAKQDTVSRVRPVWWGDNRVHSSHRAALLHKHLSYYQRFGWTEQPKLDYYWPNN